MDKETAIKSLEKGIRIAEAAESGWVWITIEQARNAVDLINYQHEHIEAFLRDQEPRLLTFMQAKGIVNGVVWVELKDRRQVDPWIVLDGKIWRPDYNTGYECWDICKEDEYNRIVRCWISKPTEEQRKAAKWNDI